MKNPSTARAVALGGLVLLVAVGGGYATWHWLAVHRQAETLATNVSVQEVSRGEVAGAEYIHVDPVSGNVLRISAERASMRDGRVAFFFRTPLKQGVVLQKVRVAFTDPAGHLLLAGSAAAGSYAPGKGAVTLENPDPITLPDCQVHTARMSLAPDGSVALAGDYTVFRNGQAAGRGRGFRGSVKELGAGVGGKRAPGDLGPPGAGQ